MRIFAMLIAGIVSILSASAAELKTFKDWVVGCDNLKTCTALGLPLSDIDTTVSYVKIVRSGEAMAAPSVEFVSYAGEDALPPDAKLALAFDDSNLSGLPAEPSSFAADIDGRFIRLSLPGSLVGDFIAALKRANSLTMTIVGSEGRVAANVPPGVASLSGASAALLHLDDIQKRVGTTTALRSLGNKDAATAPQPPVARMVAGIKMSEISDPPPQPPAVLAKKEEDENCPEGTERIAFRLSEAQTLLGICTSAGAYNLFFDFFLVEGDKAQPAVFPLPPELDKSGNQMVNPELADDGLSISSWDMARGLGDCGSFSAWAWDGANFRLVKYAAMEQCTGVQLDDWPVLYRTKLQ
jgi:hypothetical protein